MRSLFDLTRDVAKELRKGGLWEGSGATVLDDDRIQDASIGLITGAVDGGTIWFRSGLSAGNSRIIVDPGGLGATGIVTFGEMTGLTGTVDYTIFGSVYPRYALRDAVNRALQNIGEFATYGTFSSTGLQEDYNIATLVPAANMIKSVEVSAYTDPSTADNPAWMMHYGWTQFGDTLRFLADPPSYDGTQNVRIGWNTPHAELTADSDEILREVSPLRLKWEAVAEAYMHLIGPRDSEKLDEQTQNLYNRAIQTANRFPPHRNQPLPEPSLFLGVGSRGGSAINPDLQV